MITRRDVQTARQTVCFGVSGRGVTAPVFHAGRITQVLDEDRSKAGPGSYTDGARTKPHPPALVAGPQEHFMTRRERQRRRRKSAHPARRAVLLGGGLLVSGVFAAVVVFALWVVATANSAPKVNWLQPRVPGQTSEVFASNNERLGYMSSTVLRTQLAQAQQPKLLREATVAIEDRRFYQHGGVDYEGLFRAALKDLFSGGGIQGGSTLTMQLVTNVYLPDSIKDTHNLKYKIVQAKLATDLEDNHSRAWILTQYLNDVPYGTMYGQTAIGVAAASQMFFDKPVQR